MAGADFAEAAAIARAFVTARREGRGLNPYPGERPATLADAYRVQDAALALSDAAIGGWKIGKIPVPLDATYGANRLVGPIFAPAIFAAQDDTPIAMPVFADGFAAAEAEFLLRIGTAPEPGKSDYDIASATALIDAVHAGIEVASSPYPGINADGPAVTVSDFGNNNGLVVGAAIEGWRDVDVCDWPVRLTIDSATAGTGKGADMLDGPFGAAAFLFNHAARRGLTLRAGQWISSGAVTGVHVVKAGEDVEALFDDRLVVRCHIAAY